MSERIDHAKAAREHLEGVWAQNDRSLIATAQAHATLALVEQQRIANLIATFNVEGGDIDDFVTAGHNYSAALAEIVRGLA